MVKNVMIGAYLALFIFIFFKTMIQYNVHVGGSAATSIVRSKTEGSTTFFGGNQGKVKQVRHG
jgi:hypothetical protein